MRRLLRRGAVTLSDPALARIEAALAAGDANWEVTTAWACAQQLRSVYHAPAVAQGRRRAEQALASLPTCPIPEVARLGRTRAACPPAVPRRTAIAVTCWSAWTASTSSL